MGYKTGCCTVDIKRKRSFNLLDCRHDNCKGRRDNFKHCAWLWKEGFHLCPVPVHGFKQTQGFLPSRVQALQRLLRNLLLPILPKSAHLKKLFGNPCEQKPQVRAGKLSQLYISKRPLKSRNTNFTSSCSCFFLGPAPVVHIPAETVKILETVKPGSAPNKESAAGQAAWQCTLCKRMFSSKKYIVSHMKEDHHVTKEKAIDLSITEI